MKGEHGLWPVTLIGAGESLDDTPGSGQHALGPTILATVSNRVIASTDGVLIRPGSIRGLASTGA